MSLRLVIDENIPMGREVFGHFGEVIPLPGRDLHPEQLVSADILITRSVTQVNRSLLDGSSVRFVGTCTIGTDHLDTDYLNDSGVAWSNAPGCNATSVVDYVFSVVAGVRPSWQQQTFGIIGCGNVGGSLYRSLRALRVDCRVFDPFKSVVDVADLTTLDDVLDCDIVCIHAPLTQSGPHPSFHLLNAKRLRQLRSGALLINAGRGGVIDNASLIDFLNRGANVDVVLDVWEHEPDILRPLLDLVRLGSPHIAGYSYDGRLRGTLMIAEALSAFLASGSPYSKLVEQYLPGVEKELLMSVDDPHLALNEALLMAYDPAIDDQKLRSLARGDDMKTHFDALRKHYPRRRECSGYRLVKLPEKMSAASRETLAKQAAIMGFALPAN